MDLTRPAVQKYFSKSRPAHTFLSTGYFPLKRQGRERHHPVGGVGVAQRELQGTGSITGVYGRGSMTGVA